MIDNLTLIIVILIVMNIISLLFAVGSTFAHLHIAKAHHNGDIELILERLIDKRKPEPMWRGDK
jgi:hypothetical protein